MRFARYAGAERLAWLGVVGPPITFSRAHKRTHCPRCGFSLSPPDRPDTVASCDTCHSGFTSWSDLAFSWGIVTDGGVNLSSKIAFEWPGGVGRR